MEKTSRKSTTQKPKYSIAAHRVRDIAAWHLEKQGLSLVMDEEIQRLYRLMTLYFTDNKEFELNFLKTNIGKIPYSLTKGILVIGPPGRSKTFCFESIFKTFVQKYHPSRRYRIINSYTIQNAFEQDGIKAINAFRTGLRLSSPDNLYIDEIGAESLLVNHYGNRLNPVQSFLHERHKLYITSGCEIKTHASSNLVLSNQGTADLKTFYGDRIYSRLFEMFNIIITSGNDLRIVLI